MASENGDDLDLVDRPPVHEPKTNKSKGKHTTSSVFTALPTMLFDNDHTRSLYIALFSDIDIYSLLALGNPDILSELRDVVSSPVYHYFKQHHPDIFDRAADDIPAILNDQICSTVWEIDEHTDVNGMAVGSGYAAMTQRLDEIVSGVTSQEPEPRVKGLNNLSCIYNTLQSANNTHTKVWHEVQQMQFTHPFRSPLTAQIFSQLLPAQQAEFKGGATSDPVRQLQSLFPAILQGFYSHHRCDPAVIGPPMWKLTTAIGDAAKLTSEQMAGLATIFFGKAGTMAGAYGTSRRVASPYSVFVTSLVQLDRNRIFNRFCYNFFRLQADIRCLAIITIVPRILANNDIDLGHVITTHEEDEDALVTAILEAVITTIKPPNTQRSSIKRMAAARLSLPINKNRIPQCHVDYTAQHTLPSQWKDGPRDRMREDEMTKLRGQAEVLTRALADVETDTLVAILDHESFALDAPVLETFYVNVHPLYRAIQTRINDVFRMYPMLEADERLYHLATARIAYTAYTMADLTTAHSSAEQMLCAAAMQRITEEFPSAADYLEGVTDLSDAPEDEDMEEAPMEEVEKVIQEKSFQDRSLGVRCFHMSPATAHKFLGITNIAHWVGLKDEIKPHRHQTTIATAILSSIWASKEFDGSSALIADETGLGKTLAAAMIVSYLGWLNHSTLKSMEKVPLVMHTDRTFLTAHKLFPSSSKAPCKPFPRPLAIAPNHLPHIEGSPRPPGNPIIIIVPPVLITQWKQELEKTLIDRRYHVTMAIKPLTRSDVQTIRNSLLVTEDENVGDPPSHIILSTLSVLAMHAFIPFRQEDAVSDLDRERFATSFFQFNYDLVVFDEVHRYKGEKTAIHKMATKLSSLASIKIGLSATPCPNGFSELFSIMKVLCHPATRSGPDTEEDQNTGLAHQRNVQKETIKVTSLIKKQVSTDDMLDVTTAGDEDVTAAKAPRPQDLHEQMLAQWTKAPVLQAQLAKLESDVDKKRFREAIDSLNEAQDKYRRFALRIFRGSIYMRTAMSLQPTAESLGPNGYYLVKEGDQLEQLLPTIPTEIVEIDVAVRRQTLDAINAKINKSRPNLDDKPPSLAALDAFYCKARQAETHPGGALLNGLCVSLDPEEAPLAETTPKVKAIIKRIKEILEEDKDKPITQQRKIMIYMRWTSLFKYLQSEFNAEGLSFASFTGSVAIGQDRANLVDQIQRDEDHPIVPPETLASITAALEAGPPELKAQIAPLLYSRIVCCTDVANEGLNLTRCSAVIFVDETFSASVRQQITGRAVRQGQDKTVTIYTFNNKATHDSTIRSLTINKVRGSMLIPPDWGEPVPKEKAKSKSRTTAQPPRERSDPETGAPSVQAGSMDEDGAEDEEDLESRESQSSSTARPNTSQATPTTPSPSATADKDTLPDLPPARDPKPPVTFVRPLKDSEVNSTVLALFAPPQAALDDPSTRAEWESQLQPIITNIVHVLLRASDLRKIHPISLDNGATGNEERPPIPLVQLQGALSCFCWGLVKDLPKDDPRFLDFVRKYTIIVEDNGAGKGRGKKRKAPGGSTASKKPRGKSGASKGGGNAIDLELMSLKTPEELEAASVWPMSQTPTAMWARVTPEVWTSFNARKWRQVTYTRLLHWQNVLEEIPSSKVFEDYITGHTPFNAKVNAQDTITLRGLVDSMKAKSDQYTYQAIVNIVDVHPYPVCFHEGLVPTLKDMALMLESEFTICDPEWAHTKDGIRDHRRWYSVVRFYLCRFLFGIQEDTTDPPLRNDVTVTYDQRHKDWAIRFLYVHDAITSSPTYRASWNAGHTQTPKGFPTSFRPDRVLFAQFVIGSETAHEHPPFFGEDWNIATKQAAIGAPEQEPTEAMQALEAFEQYVQMYDPSDPLAERPQS